MIFFHKPYYNPNYTNLTKNNSNDICPKPKKLYKVYKLYNRKHFLKKTQEKNLKQKFKTLKLHRFIQKKKP